MKWTDNDTYIALILGIVFVALVYINPLNHLPSFSALTDFQLFALLVSFGYDALPTMAQQFSLGAIHTELLQTGFDPTIFVILSAVGLLVGQSVLYLFGMFVRKVHKGSIGNIASKHHIFHKYHFLIYLIVPFIGILGDFAMIFSGHQRINPLKLFPFLFIGDLVSSARWIYPAVAQLEISKLFGG